MSSSDKMPKGIIKQGRRIGIFRTRGVTVIKGDQEPVRTGVAKRIE